MSNLSAHTEPLIVELVEDEIVLTGRSGPTGLSLTPGAALETAERLVSTVRQTLPQASQDDGEVA